MPDLLGLGEDLLFPLLGSSPQSEHQVEGRLLLDVVARKGPSILELLASEDEALLIRRDSLLVLNLLLHILDGVRRLNLEGDGFTCKEKRKFLVSVTAKSCSKRRANNWR